MNNNNIIPSVIYNNMYLYKSSIISDNINKCGTYRITNLTSSKLYIRSSNNLGSRFRAYFNPNQLKRANMYIYNAMLKHGYSNFSLDILEYCEPNALIKREQYYIDTLEPEYNILKIAGSTLGRVHSISTRKKISNSIKGINHPNYGKHHSYETRKALSAKFLNRVHIMPKMKLETKLKLSLVTIGVNVKIFDLQDKLIKEFSSINSAAKYYGVASSTINKAIKKSKPYNNLIFKSEIKDNRVWVYDLDHKFIKALDNMSKTSKEFNIPSTTLSRYINSEKL